MAAPQISALPTPPSRADDGETFSSKADDFLGALPTFRTEANSQATYLDGLAAQVDSDASTSAANASAAQTSADNAAASEAGVAADAATASAAASAASDSEAAAAASAASATASASAASTSASTAQSAASQAQTAAEASGDIKFYDTYALADAAKSGLENGQTVEVYEDETRDGDRARYVKESGPVLTFKIKLPSYDSQFLLNAMSRAEWEAQAEARRTAMAGSGSVEMGKHSTTAINDGMWISGTSGVLRLGGGTLGGSRTVDPMQNVNGALLRLYGIRNSSDDNLISFPDAPADSSLLSRQDLVFLEVSDEDVTENDFVPPYCNNQYGATTWNGIALTQALAASYSAFGAWEASPVAGYGAVWSTLSAANKDAFIREPQNNLRNDNGTIVREGYGIRVVAGLGDNWLSVNGNQSAPRYDASNYVKAKGKQLSLDADFTSTASLGFNTNAPDGDRGAMYNATAANSYSGKVWYIPIALVQRRNQGAFHPVHNPNGCARFLNTDLVTPALWYNTDQTVTSAADCFTFSNGDGSTTSATSGRPDGLYHDQFVAKDWRDLRNDANRVQDMPRLLEREFRKLVSGTLRGFEGYRYVAETVVATPTAKADAGLQIRLDFAASTFTQFTDTSLYTGSATAVFSQDNKANAIVIDAAGNPFAAVWLRSSTNDELYLHHVHGDVTSVIDITGPCTVLVLDKSDHKAETLLHCDIVTGDVSLIAEGEHGVPLVVAEDGTELLADGAKTVFKLSRKITSSSDIKQVTRENTGVFTAFALTTDYTINATLNTITFTTPPAAADKIRINYNVKANPFEVAANAEVLELGDVFSQNHHQLQYGSLLTRSLSGKVPVGSAGVLLAVDGRATGFAVNTDSNQSLLTNAVYSPSHQALSISALASPAAKVLPYLTRSNGKAYLQLLFKELLFDVDYGDTGDFAVVDNLSTAVDSNGNTVIVGQKRVELPQFILDAS